MVSVAAETTRRPEDGEGSFELGWDMGVQWRLKGVASLADVPKYVIHLCFLLVCH